MRSRFYKLVLAGLLAWTVLEIFSFRWILFGPKKLQVSTAVTRQKIFIASTHWNNEIILREHWNNAVLDLVRFFGSENVFVSVYESGSWDDSKGALRLLDKELEKLGAPRTIVLDDTTHTDEIEKSPAPSGWIDTPRGKRELRRIPYLSRLRNLSLEPLGTLLQSGIVFDKVLFLNDVVFTVSSGSLVLAYQDRRDIFLSYH